MSYPKEIINKVKSLRAKGKTFSEIRKELKIAVAKSTLSDWCHTVVMPKWYKAKIDELNKTSFSKARKMSWASTRLRRENLLKTLRERNNSLPEKIKDSDTLKIILAILYLGEGSKWRSHSGLQLGSSDPNIILLYIRLLELCYGMSRKNLKCRVSYRADQNIRALERYWSKIAGIPLENFYKTIPDPRTVGKPTKKLDYKGVCVIVGGSSTIQLEFEMIPGILLTGLP